MARDLDPDDWPAFRAQAHRMLDDILDYQEHLRERPVWRPIPEDVRDSVREPLPRHPTPLDEVHRLFMARVLPYAAGNAHPRFMGWVHGGGTPVGALAEMLAGGLNTNVGGRDQMPVELERTVAAWARDMFGFPAGASGLFVTGTSMATFTALLVARSAALGERASQGGVGDHRLRAYTSAAAHTSLARAFDFAGLGRDALRHVPVNARHELDVEALEAAIRDDRARGLQPFLVAPTVGTVGVGAVDDLQAVHALAQREGLWMHVDGALGALAVLAPDIAPRLRGIEHADSLAFDFHKWGQVPYDAGFLLVADGERHRGTFASHADYLARATRGLAAGSPWPCDYGPDLSRGFRALKTWFTLKTYGADHLGRVIARTCAVARHLGARVEASPHLELLAPVALNIVCFRFRCDDADAVNEALAADLQEAGVAAPSTTLVDGAVALRAAIVNHRTTNADVDALVEAVERLGRARVGAGPSRSV